MASRTDQRVRPTGDHRWAAAAVALAAACVLGACGGPDDEPGSATRWTDALTEARDAGPDQVDAHAVTTQRDGATHTVLGVQDDGTLLASRVSGTPDAKHLGTPRVGSLDADGFNPLRYDASSSRDRQVTAAERDGDTLVWVETLSTDPYLFDWTIWSSTGRGRTEVDSSSRLGPASQQPRAFGATAPVMAGDDVFWAGGIGPRDDASVDVFSSSTDGVRGEQRAGAMPAVAGSTLYSVRSPETGDDGATRVVARPVAGGAEHTVVEAELPGSSALTRLVASAHHLAWVVSEPEAGTSRLYVRDLRDGSTRGVTMDHPGLQTMSLDLSDDLVVWGSGSAEGDAGQYAMDLSDGDVWRLHDQPGYSVAFVEGRTVAWAQLPEGPGARAEFEVGRWKG